MATPERVFLDSNVLVYAYSFTDLPRRERARELANLPDAVISTQVLSEFANVLLRKFAIANDEVRNRVAEVAARCHVIALTPAIILDAFRVRGRYRLGFYDSQIIATALAASAGVLYSEDMHDGLLVDGTLRIIAPFRLRTEQARKGYRVRPRRPRPERTR